MRLKVVFEDNSGYVIAKNAEGVLWLGEPGPPLEAKVGLRKFRTIDEYSISYDSDGNQRLDLHRVA